MPEEASVRENRELVQKLYPKAKTHLLKEKNHRHEYLIYEWIIGIDKKPTIKLIGEGVTLAKAWADARETVNKQMLDLFGA
jgi:hypothetical protein